MGDSRLQLIDRRREVERFEGNEKLGVISVKMVVDAGGREDGIDRSRVEREARAVDKGLNLDGELHRKEMCWWTWCWHRP